jgi:hypothetical protein
VYIQRSSIDATRTSRLKSGADTLNRKPLSMARRDFHPTFLRLTGY